MQLTAIFTVLVLIFVGVAVLISESHSSDSEDDITGYWYQVGYEGYRSGEYVSSETEHINTSHYGLQ